MLGQREHREPELFVAGSVRELLPDDHVLVRVDRVLDLGWPWAEAEPLCRTDAGRPRIASPRVPPGPFRRDGEGLAGCGQAAAGAVCGGTCGAGLPRPSSP